MKRWLRVFVAAAALAGFAAPLVPLHAGSNAGCACAMRCCCNPHGTGAACRLSRPCGTADGGGTVPAAAGFRPAVIAADVPRPVLPGLVARVAAVSDRRTRSSSLPPPVPPPRPASSC